jgi:hypothetical protein
MLPTMLGRMTRFPALASPLCAPITGCDELKIPFSFGRRLAEFCKKSKGIGCRVVSVSFLVLYLGRKALRVGAKSDWYGHFSDVNLEE